MRPARIDRRDVQALQQIVRTFAAEHEIERLGDLAAKLPDFPVSLPRPFLSRELARVHAVLGADFAAQRERSFSAMAFWLS